MSEHSESGYREADDAGPDPIGPDPIRPLRHEEDARYLLHDAREIGRVLQALIDRRALVSAYIAPRNRTFPTSLVELSLDEDWVSIDGSRDPAINAQVEQCHHLTCVSMLDRIPIQFRLGEVLREDADGLATFRASIPDRLLHLQRREYHRCRVPVAEPLRCSIATAPSPGRQEPERIELGVLDISVGGMCLALPPHCEALPASGEIEGVLQMPEVEPIAMRFRVRSRFPSTTSGACDLTRAGCEFTQLPRGAETLIQRYIFRQDRQRKARERGEA